MYVYLQAKIRYKFTEDRTTRNTNDEEKEEATPTDYWNWSKRKEPYRVHRKVATRSHNFNNNNKIERVREWKKKLLLTIRLSIEDNRKKNKKININCVRAIFFYNSSFLRKMRGECKV